LINFGLFGLFGLSDLEKIKPNQKTKTELAKILNRKTEPNNPKFNDLVQNQLNRSVCTHPTCCAAYYFLQRIWHY
jgi:hypothetical protein